MKKFLRLILLCLFPPFCCGCQKTGTYICNNCYDEVVFLCNPLSISVKNRCISEVYAVTVYNDVIKKLIHAMKYQHVKGITHFLGELIYMTSTIPKVDYITFVPMHPERQTQRGYNQSYEIAKHVSLLINVPLLDVMKKQKETMNQASIKNKEKRENNMVNTFVIDKENIAAIKNKNVLIIDDVCTTGNTLNTCAKVLMRNGAQEVKALVIAHKTT